jgi:hypothetical protein
MVSQMISLASLWPPDRERRGAEFGEREPGFVGWSGAGQLGDAAHEHVGHGFGDA